MKILILSQHIFPMQTPRAHRTTELMKEFARQGNVVTVYSVLGKYDYSNFLNEFPLIKLKNIPLKWMWHPYNSDSDGKRYFIDKLLGKILGKLFLFPNFEFYYRINEIMSFDNDYDAVISIADPHQIHWGVAKYRKKNIKPFPKIWIADCGDPFMNNEINSRYPKKFSRFEHLFCQQADFISVPEDDAKNGYYKIYSDKIKIIPQGFDFRQNEDKKILQNTTPVFAYAGNFYEDIRNPENFMDVLCSIDKPFKFIVYSNYTRLLDKFQNILGDKLEIKNVIQRTELLKELEKVDFLVNLANINSPYQIPSKLIDYSITGRPIININPKNPNALEINQFLEGNYESAYVIKEINRYHIKNVVNEFIKLIG